MDFIEELRREITDAVRKCITDLLSNGEHYYYISLVTDGLANTPCISAWSVEALERERQTDAENADMIKWSYADSPYCCWKQEYFHAVDQLLGSREVEEDRLEEEYECRLSAMEDAIREMDREGLFSSNQERNTVMVLVEVMPPDYTNTERAYRLNDPNTAIFAEWLEEAAEEEES